MFLNTASDLWTYNSILIVAMASRMEGVKCSSGTDIKYCSVVLVVRSQSKLTFKNYLHTSKWKEICEYI